RFVLRAYSPVITIAGGTVIEPHAPKRRRIAGEDAKGFTAVLSGTPRDALGAALDAAGVTGLDPAVLAVRLGRTDTDLDAVLEAAITDDRAVRAGTRVFAAPALEQARSLVLEAVERVHRDQPLRAGADREEL